MTEEGYPEDLPWPSVTRLTPDLADGRGGVEFGTRMSTKLLPMVNEEGGLRYILIQNFSELTSQGTPSRACFSSTTSSINKPLKIRRMLSKNLVSPIPSNKGRFIQGVNEGVDEGVVNNQPEFS